MTYIIDNLPLSAGIICQLFVNKYVISLIKIGMTLLSVMQRGVGSECQPHFLAHAEVPDRLSTKLR